MAQPFRTEVGTFEEVRRALRAIARLLGTQTGTTAAIDADIPSLTQVINAHGGLAQASVEGKLVSSDRLGRWSALLVGDNGRSLIADSSEDLGMRWDMLGEIPIAMRFASSVQPIPGRPTRLVWNIIAPPVQNLAADPYQSTFGDWVQTNAQDAGALVVVALPVITAESKGLMVGANSSGVLGDSATFQVKASGTDTISIVSTGVLQTVRSGALVFISDGVSNWIRYFSL